MVSDAWWLNLSTQYGTVCRRPGATGQGPQEGGAAASRPGVTGQGPQKRGAAASRPGATGQGPQERGAAASRPGEAGQGPPKKKLLTTSKSYSAEREVVLFSPTTVRAFGNNYGSVYISYRGTEVSVSI